jgi:hypothetical protein
MPGNRNNRIEVYVISFFKGEMYMKAKKYALSMKMWHIFCVWLHIMGKSEPEGESPLWKNGNNTRISMISYLPNKNTIPAKNEVVFLLDERDW